MDPTLKTYSPKAKECMSLHSTMNNPATRLHLFSCLDYTTLSATDTSTQIVSMAEKVNRLYLQNKHLVAGICVFPNFIETLKNHLKVPGLPIVSVSACFPFAQSFLPVKLLETEMAVKAGAQEIDIVLPLHLLLDGKENKVVEEVKSIKLACGNSPLKVILETTLLNDAPLIRTAAALAIDGGADFIKTSTGKNGSAASPEAFYVMCEAVAAHYQKTGKRVGIKAAGGISDTASAMQYYAIVKEVLGAEWAYKKYFRIGASRLFDEILAPA